MSRQIFKLSHVNWFNKARSIQPILRLWSTSKQTDRQANYIYTINIQYTNTVHTSLIFLYEDVEANISVPGAKTIYSGAIKRLFSSTINHSVFSVLLFINFCLYQITSLVGNPALPRLLVVTPAVYPPLVVNFDFSCFSTHLNNNLKT